MYPGNLHARTLCIASRSYDTLAVALVHFYKSIDWTSLTTWTFYAWWMYNQFLSQEWKTVQQYNTMPKKSSQSNSNSSASFLSITSKCWVFKLLLILKHLVNIQICFGLGGFLVWGFSVFVCWFCGGLGRGGGVWFWFLCLCFVGLV